ncbi:MAG: hypothetical protein HWE16_00440 [Gammaproteobacteria bacterium]|nr:hypothetical protein [Gammaproteobacteria bacterium]
MLFPKTYAIDCESNLSGKLELLPADIAKTLAVASNAFCEVQLNQNQQVFRVRVTGTTRSISDQARYIYQCLKRDGCQIYENQEAIREFKAIENVSPKKLELQIQDQLRRNCFISKHLSNRAVDIGTRNMPRQQVTLLAQLIADTEYYVDGEKFRPDVINRSHGTGPHLHVNFKPYYFDPAKCPKDYSFQME